MFTKTCSYQKRLIYHNKFTTSNLIISNNSSPYTGLPDTKKNHLVRSNIPWDIVSPTKIIRMLILPLQLFQEGLRCTLMILAS